MDKIHIPRTTLLCVDTLNHELAARALMLSLSGCTFERALFLTDRPINVAGVETLQIPTIAGRMDYSKRMLRDLGQYVQSEFVLVIQWDGYVLNPDVWDDGFLEYDYIGACWGYDDGKNVGNGGFSLRSRRLLEILGSVKANVIGAENEDEAICRRLRPWLQDAHEIRDAPEAVADRFSIERVGLNPRPFGFHGLFNMAGLVAGNELDWFCSRVPEGAWRSQEFFEFIVHLEAIGRTEEAQRASAHVAARIGAAARDQALQRARSLVNHYARVRHIKQQA